MTELSGEDCQGNSCPGPSMADSSTQTLILVTSSLACLAVIIDLAARYAFSKSDGDGKKVLQEKEQQTEEDQEQHETEEEALVAQTTAVVSEAAPTGQGYVLRGSVKPSMRARRASSTQLTDMLPKIEEPTRVRDEVFQMEEAQRLTSDGLGVRDLLNDLVDSLRSTVHLGGPVEDLPRSLNDKMAKIGELTKECNTLSADFDHCSVALVKDTEGEEQPESERAVVCNGDKYQMKAYQKQRHALYARWSSLRRLFFCVDVHLRNAGNYQQFFYDADELRKQLTEFNKYVNEALKQEDLPNDMQKTVDEIKQICDCIKLWECSVKDIRERSMKIVPVRMRTENLDESVPVRALCSYRDGTLSVHEGDMMTLTSNTDKEAWEVSTAEGDTGCLPPVAVLIPAPDMDALKASQRLQRLMLKAYEDAFALLLKWLIHICIEVHKQILAHKSTLLAAVHAENKDEIGSSQERLIQAYDLHFGNEPRYSELIGLHKELKTHVNQASDTRKESDKLRSDVIDMLYYLEKLLGILHGLYTRMEAFEAYVYNTGLEDDDQDEVDEAGLAISVQQQRDEVGEASSYMSATGEVRQTFSIRAILDPRDNSEMSMDDAIKRGIINASEGLYINPVTKEEIPIPIAMNAGFILVESSDTKQSKESTSAVGVVTVTITRETRPYTVKRVRDPRNDGELSVAEALEAGIFDPDKGVWKNPHSGDTMNIKDAIDSGLIMVEYDEDAEVSEPEVTTRTFVVHGVMDTKTGQRVPFYEACQKGLIDKEAGVFIDSSTGDKMHMVDAAKKGLVKARVVDDPSKVDQYIEMVGLRPRSGTNDSE